MTNRQKEELIEMIRITKEHGDMANAKYSNKSLSELTNEESYEAGYYSGVVYTMRKIMEVLDLRVEDI